MANGRRETYLENHWQRHVRIFLRDQSEQAVSHLESQTRERPGNPFSACQKCRRGVSNPTQSQPKKYPVLKYHRVENFVPGKMDKMGIGYEKLREINPLIIYASVSGQFSIIMNPYSP